MICQIVILFGGLNGMFSDVNIDWISIFERKVLYLVKSSKIFTVLDVVGRHELPEEFYAFCINLMKVYLSNEESII
jgi:hypothetical protein